MSRRINVGSNWRSGWLRRDWWTKTSEACHIFALINSKLFYRTIRNEEKSTRSKRGRPYSKNIDMTTTS